MTRKREVWFDGRKLCAKMPALILVGNEMEPMWKQEDADVADDVVCINQWRAGWTIVRVGSGWGRHRGAHYYYVDFTTKLVTKARRVPTKNIYTQSWMDCLDISNISTRSMCFEWRDGRLVRGPIKPG